jgi:hypothetical protein
MTLPPASQFPVAQSIEALPYAVPGSEALRQDARPNVLDGEEMERFEKAPIIPGFASPSRQAGAKHRQRMRPIFLVHLRGHAPKPPIRSETYESCLMHLGNPKTLI